MPDRNPRAFSPRRRVPELVIVGAAFAAVVTLSACTAKHHSTTGSSATVTSASAADSGSASSPSGSSGGQSSGGAATSASSSASSAPAPAVNTCGSALTITAERLPGAQDASYALLTFTNTGASACNLGGYPSATLLDDKKASMTAPLTRTADTVSTISLDPQASASTLLKDSSVSCQAQTRSTYVRVSAPASSKNVDLSLALAPCALSARPLVAGTNPQP